MKFSILMANYNNGRFIGDAISSVKNQTYKDWEIVIVDDASTDNSLQIIEPLLADERIKLFKNIENTGCGAAKKKCADNASGEILAILDPDDIIDPRALEVMASAYENNPAYGMIYSTHYECDENLKIKGLNQWVGELREGETNLIKPRTSHFKTFRKTAYLKTSGFDKNLPKAVDKDIIYKLEEVTKLKHVNEPLYHYRMHKNCISLNQYENEAHICNIIAKYKAYQRRIAHGYVNLSREKMAYLLCEGGLRAIYDKDFEKFHYFMKEAWRTNNSYPKCFILLIYIFAQKSKHALAHAISWTSKRIFLKNSKALKKFYELQYWKKVIKKEKKFKNDHFEFYYTRLFELDATFFDRKKILDIGCGPRGSLAWAKNASARIGLDPLAGDYLKLGADHRAMDYIKAYSEEIPFAENWFDIVCSFNSLDHVDNVSQTLNEIARVLKTGGLFLLITEFNHHYRVCEPQTFTAEISQEFNNIFKRLDEKKYIKLGGIYESIASKIIYSEHLEIPGVLVGKYIK